MDVADIIKPAGAGGVELAIDGGLAIITIDRPAVRNAIGFATVDELHEALAWLESSDAAVTVLTGGGDRAFVSGGDLKELATVRTHAEATDMASNVRDVLDRLASLPMPVIAAMNGHALGGGAEVSVAADIRLAASDIRIGFSQVTLGIMPAWGGIERLVQLVGRSRALLAITSGTQYDATTAHGIGLVDAVIPRADFDAEWRAIAGRMASLAPGAARSMKAVVAAAAPAVRHDTRADAIDHFAHLWAAPAHWEAVEAAQQQRKR
ncbi:MAG: enoyl-CoA hydratase/isomerase family protein [Frankiaceae bacterium]|nr:enoyl-CoA hydratase/isomerase family protein [Frankiaceae bacterium]MBV9870445.1 enoyl-CoA hydratase/isomerase family protein [Frankiaceae bacterium]